MPLEKAAENGFQCIKDFYWNHIDAMKNQADIIGWEKGIYPTDIFLKESLSKGELYVLRNGSELTAAVILNPNCNKGYKGVPWSLEYAQNDILIPHALAVAPRLQGHGVGKIVVDDILEIAKKCNKKAVRLDILAQNRVAEKLYTKCGFQFVQEKELFYEDTGLTAYRMFEQNLIFTHK